MKVAITGAAGFIGSHLSEAVLRQGHEVVGIDNFDPFYDRSLKERNLRALLLDPRFSLADVDIRDGAAVEAVLEGVDAVVHLAARAGVRPSLIDPGTWSDVNVTGTAVLLDAAARQGVERVVFASSSSVYGEGAARPFRESGATGVPASPYAVSKAAGEMLCRTFAARIPHLTMLRFFTVYGPRQRPDLAVHKFARQILAGEPVTIFGTEDSFRDYTYVSDTVRGVVAALEVEQPGLVLNLASGRPVRLGEVVDRLEAAIGRRADRVIVPAPHGEVYGTWGDISQAREHLGYEPQWTFSDGVDSFVSWLEEVEDLGELEEAGMASRPSGAPAPGRHGRRIPQDGTHDRASRIPELARYAVPELEREDEVSVSRWLTREIDRARRHSRSLTMVTLSSKAGSPEITSVARLLAAHIRESDVLSHDRDGRLLLIAPEASSPDCLALLKRLAVGRFPDVVVGMASFPDDAVSWESLKARAVASEGSLKIGPSVAPHDLKRPPVISGGIAA